MNKLEILEDSTSLGEIIESNKLVNLSQNYKNKKCSYQYSTSAKIIEVNGCKVPTKLQYRNGQDIKKSIISMIKSETKGTGLIFRSQSANIYITTIYVDKHGVQEHEKHAHYAKPGLHMRFSLRLGFGREGHSGYAYRSNIHISLCVHRGIEVSPWNITASEGSIYCDNSQKENLSKVMRCIAWNMMESFNISGLEASFWLRKMEGLEEKTENTQDM